MTRLFNLESYTNLCTNTNLYTYELQIETPAAYKSFLDRYRELGYRSDSLYPPELTVPNELMPLKHLGVNLSPDDDRLYVVGDRINFLSLRNFLKPGERYIYRSVCHYWNYRQQIANNLDLNRSVVFIDLGSLSNQPYCSLRFERSPNSPYLTLIIDNRREASSDFKLALDIKNIHHNNIYHDLAREILTCNFPQLANNYNTVEHLKTYLQKIEVFKLAQSQGEPDIFFNCVNGKTQEYQILHPLSKPEPSLEKLKIRIKFIVKLGTVPELKVTDRENRYKIETKLQDYIEQKVSLNCVPLKTILEYREQQFKNKVFNDELCKKVSLSLASIVKINSFEQLPAIVSQIRSANETIKLSRRKQKAEGSRSNM